MAAGSHVLGLFFSRVLSAAEMSTSERLVSDPEALKGIILRQAVVAGGTLRDLEQAAILTRTSGSCGPWSSLWAEFSEVLFKPRPIQSACARP